MQFLACSPLRPLAAILLCVLSASARPSAADTTRPESPPKVQKHPPDSIEFTPDITYGKGGDEDLKLDLSRPKKSDHPLPCIVVIHGGGWTGGDRTQHDDATWNIAAAGYVAATVEYRLAPAHPFPAQVQDVKCAVRFLRANAAKYGIDPERIAAIGFSAGAHLSMMLGATTEKDGLEGDGGWPGVSSQVQAVVSFSGPTDLTADDIPDVSKGLIKTFLGGSVEEKHGAAVKASPVTFLHKGCPPMLIFQGTADPLIPGTQAYRMADAMTKAGVPGRVEILIGEGHGYAAPAFVHALEQGMVFLNQNLKK